MLSTIRVQVMNAFEELESIMDVVVRTYTGKGSKELFALLEERKTDVEKLMRSVKGFESYTLARSSASDGGLSLTVCQPAPKRVSALRRSGSRKMQQTLAWMRRRFPRDQ